MHQFVSLSLYDGVCGSSFSRIQSSRMFLVALRRDMLVMEQSCYCY